MPTIQGRDFVVATLAAPTIIKEPEKPAEETAEEDKATEKKLLLMKELKEKLKLQQIRRKR